MRKTPLFASLAIHAAFVALLLLVTVAVPPVLKSRKTDVRTVTKLAPYPGKKAGGGDNSPLPARYGQIKAAHPTRTFIPPTLSAPEHPKLPMEAAMLPSPDMPATPFARWGDPLGKGDFPSLGPGHFGGVGPGDGGGYGPDKGPGMGGKPSITGRSISRDYIPPRLIYRVEPEYSEQARKAKYQGTVTLAVEVGVDGRVREARVIQGLGLGLDEKAVDAILQWRFQPAMQSGRAIAAPATIEVNFRLL